MPATRNILGISAYYHDAAAALLRDGEIAAAAQEERYTRKKNDPDFPRQAIQFCLRHAGLLGRELFADNKLLEAGSEYQEVIRLQPTNPVAHINLGVVLAKQNQLAEAIKQFEEALRLDPTNQQAQLYRAQAQTLMQ
jgi:predicted NodU family carbamoyl transferase